MGEIGLKDAPEGKTLEAGTQAVLKNMWISEEDAKKFANREVIL